MVHGCTAEMRPACRVALRHADPAKSRRRCAGPDVGPGRLWSIVLCFHVVSVDYNHPQASVEIRFVSTQPTRGIPSPAA